MACTCSYLRVGMSVIEQRNWNPDCKKHGTLSAWYNSDEQVAKRRAADERLAELQAQAKEARRAYKEAQ